MSRWASEIRARLAAARLEPAREAEIAQELAAHLDDRFAEARRDGLSEADATRAALDELNEDALMRQQLAAVSRLEPVARPVLGDPVRRSFLADLRQDVRYAGRVMRAKPGFAALAVLTLALGIGATTIVYTLIDNVLLRPLPYKDLDRLVRVFEIDARRPDRLTMVSYPDFLDWRARTRTLEALAIYNSAEITLLDDEPVRANAASVTPEFFAVNGVAPLVGRGFTDGDAEPGAPRVVILGYGAWQRRFGGDAATIGRQVRTVDGPYEVVGILPPEPIFWGTTDFWVPRTRAAGVPMRESRAYPVLARLKAGVTIEQARADMEEIAAALARDYPATNGEWSVKIVPLQEQTVGYVRPTLFTLLAAVGCILLIACVNVAGLLVARGADRAREVAIRSSLGASRWRVIRQLATESVVLAVVGGGAGVLIAWLALGAVVGLLPVRLPTDAPIAIDLRVLAVALGASVVTGVLFGLVPAIGLSGQGLADGIKEANRATPRWGRRLGAGLVLVEVAASLVLLAGAGLMVRTLAALHAVDPGFEAERVMNIPATPLLPRDAPLNRAKAFYDAFLERIAALPGVESAALIDMPPFGGSWSGGLALADGSSKTIGVSSRSATPGYFRTMGIPIAAGRDFTAADRDGAPLVTIVSQDAAARFWPGENPLGRRLRFKGRVKDSDPYLVVGIAGDVRHRGLDYDVMTEVYLPMAQKPTAAASVVVRTGDPAGVAALARGQMSGLPERAIAGRIRRFGELIDRTTVERRNRALLLGVLGGLGVVLAAVGVFGLTGYSVAQRSREIGVRIALGASGQRVLATILGTLLPPIAGGLAVGLAGAWWAMQALKQFVFGVTPTDPLTLVIVAALLGAVALIACLVPARRALRTDPVVALRAE